MHYFILSNVFWGSRDELSVNRSRLSVNKPRNSTLFSLGQKQRRAGAEIRGRKSAAYARGYGEPRRSEDRERLESVKLRWSHALSRS